MNDNNNFYVYVYIDPRNYEEFYYGKGKGSRKYAQLGGNIDPVRAKRINEIRKAGQEPVIKVIASNLTEQEAFLIEATLIWKFEKSLNKVAGRYSRKFRPQDTMHLNLPKFDFQNGFYFINTGEEWRSWEDNVKYGFVSAGQGEKYSTPLKPLQKGDLIAAYVNGKGYVGIGRVEGGAVMIRDFKYKGCQLSEKELSNKHILKNLNNPKKADWAVPINWIKKVPKAEAKRKKGIFYCRSIKASLANQKKTVDFLEREFDFKINNLSS